MELTAAVMHAFPKLGGFIAEQKLDDERVSKRRGIDLRLRVEVLRNADERQSVRFSETGQIAAEYLSLDLVTEVDDVGTRIWSIVTHLS